MINLKLKETKSYKYFGCCDNCKEEIPDWDIDYSLKGLCFHCSELKRKS